MALTELQPVVQRLLEVESTINKLRELCKVAGISVGVVHEGAVVLAKGYGALDPRQTPPVEPDSETLFTLCSISKAFVSAAVGILVDEGKLAWTDPVGKYLPDFHPKDDGRVAEQSTIIDFLRHTGGLSNPVVTLLGPGGKVLVPNEKDFIQLVNDAPTSDGAGKPNFHRWMYSNIAVGLVTLIIERASGQSYADFLRQRVLEPLKMHDTVVSAGDLEGNPKVGHGYAQMEDKSWSQLEHEWTSETNSPVLGMVGVRSSVRDMMVFSAAVLEALHSDLELKDFGVLVGVQSNPLREMGRILNGPFCTRPSNDPFNTKAAYHLGWLRTTMPTCMTWWGGWNSILRRDVQSPDHQALRDKSILGQESQRRRLIKASGVGFCGTSSLHLFPDTKSIIVVFSNGLNCADASDLVASVLTQALFELEPKVDLKEVAEKQSEVHRAQFRELVQDWEAHRNVLAEERSHSEYIGTYCGLGIRLLVGTSDHHPKALQLCLNGREDVVQQLEFYNVDQYSYMPKTRDDWLRGGWLDWDFFLVGMLTFTRDEAGKVNGLTWVWEKGAKPQLFTKVQD